MKKLLFILILCPFFNFLIAQEIGIRLGEMAGNNVAIDAVYPLKEGRIHGNIIFGNGVGIDVIYDFIYKPIQGLPNFHYYLGIGITTLFKSDYELGAATEVGIAYQFTGSPLTLSLDYRPSIIVLESTIFHWNGFGLNFRYVLN
ncbi:MAG: hypothetical protein L3J34_01170 [Flavobacteriaceae bacterium]|nr:hypothetical protein [Flavobacteriaceae bacterium]